ncbi:replication protein A 32 kDa subunit isoform X2 [Tribolium castaneum]|uniref:Replication protein A 32 kDa subunit-like Protein n=1 Tax=Tribolium castaneum TaxID=7070 RepID=D2A5W4_TRICA|nr:PREDICTED: replication protein A 32 kDa subunit [Tribolium castaneum]EFA05016.1 Replication protein A 32 kDa subunit-like Protein [Tribolium castaneum]|eukprot:XP_969120.1 PREDICTED: replication protein A 32 kDa subunit [Tribolium castaneum]
MSSVQPRTQPVVPVIIDQILSCKHPSFQIAGKAVHITCLIGVISNIHVDSLEITCNIQDQSGKIKGAINCDSESEVNSKLVTLIEGKYSKIFASIRIQNCEKVVMIMKTFPVDDLNELSSHLLNVLSVKFEAEAELNQELSCANTLADALEMGEDSATPRISEFQRLVFNIVKSDFSEFGVTRRNVLKQFPSYQGHEVNQALEHLISQGAIYLTIDQDHLKAVTNFY